MSLDEHATSIGQIVTNLQSLELVLRLFLGETHQEKIEFPDPKAVSVPLTHLTNYDTLGRLIRKFNKALNEDERKQFSVDEAVVNVRDAIAHGRIVGAYPNPPYMIYKFGSPDPHSRFVPVERREFMDDAWIDRNRQLVADQLQRVVGAARSRNYKFLGD